MGNTKSRDSSGTLVGSSARTSIEKRLSSAIEVGDVEALRKLIVQGANPNITFKDGLTPLILASGLGQVDIVEYLL